MAERTEHAKSASAKATETKDADPMSAFRDMRDAYMETWSKSMVDAVNTEAYAKASGTILDGYLTTSAPFREALEKTMLHALQQLSMPSRADVLSVAERLTNLEMKLDDMDAKLDHLGAASKKTAAVAPTRKTAPRVQKKRKGSK